MSSTGRTDKGVSAYMQVGSCNIDVEITPYKLKRAMNTFLPDEIYIKDVEEVDDEFHPRYMVKEKTYLYKINMGEFNPIEKDYVNQLCKELDVDIIKSEIKDFEGTHDFSAFCSTEDKKEDSIRTIFKTNVTRDKDYLILSFTGNGFLKYMVRIMTGYLIDVSLGKREKGKIKEYLQAKEKVTTKTAAATGLYLKEVKY